MKNIFALILLGLVAASCQSGTEQKSTPATPAQQLVIMATIEEKLYVRPTVSGLAIAMVEPQEMLQVIDTTDYFFY